MKGLAIEEGKLRQQSLGWLKEGLVLGVVTRPAEQAWRDFRSAARFVESRKGRANTTPRIHRRGSRWDDRGAGHRDSFRFRDPPGKQTGRYFPETTRIPLRLLPSLPHPDL